MGFLFAPYGWVSDYAVFLLPALLLQRQLWVAGVAAPQRIALMAFMLAMFFAPAFFGVALNGQVYLLAALMLVLTPVVARREVRTAGGG
jgi:hypothetical protein